MASAVVTPQIQLKKTTNAGVNCPSPNPAIPLLALKGKMMNSCTAVGKRLKRLPFRMGFELSIGRKNNQPQIPPQTMRGYSHAADNDGAMATENCFVRPISPNSHTARLFSNAPKHPAAKNMSNFFMDKTSCLKQISRPCPVA